MKELLCTWFYNKQLKLLESIWCKWNVCLDLAKRNRVNNSRGVIWLNIFSGLWGTRPTFLSMELCSLLASCCSPLGSIWSKFRRSVGEYVCQSQEPVPSSVLVFGGLEGQHLEPPLRKTMKKKTCLRSWAELKQILGFCSSVAKVLPMISPCSKATRIRWEV